eukprot:753790-Hanusia_phi.AAC.14
MKKPHCCIEAKEMLKFGKHPNLMHLTGKSEEGETLLFFVEGPHVTLDVFLRDLGAVPQEHRMAMIHQIASGMEHLASNGIVHKCLAASHVLLIVYDRADIGRTSVKVTDYWLASEIFDNFGFFSGLPDIVGHAAPEVLNSQSYSEKSDVWAFGVTMWQILSSMKVPYGSLISDYFQVKHFVCSGGRPERSEIEGGCSDYVWERMTSCWNHDPNDRPSFSDLAVALRSEGEARLPKKRQANCRNELDEAWDSAIEKADSQNKAGRIQPPLEQGWRGILAGMRRHEELAEVQDAGLYALKVAMSDENCVFHAVRAGLIEVVVKGMKKHWNHQGIQYAGCRLLDAIAIDGDIAIRIKDAGGIEAVVMALKTFIMDWGIQFSGFEALSSMVIVREVKLAAASAGVIETVVAGMEEYEPARIVQNAACLVLFGLAEIEDNRAKIGRSGAIGAIMSGMAAHEHEHDVQENALRALTCIADCKENREIAIRDGIIEVTVLAMENHERVEIQALGCRVLKLLIMVPEDPVAARRTGLAGGIEAVVAAMSKDEDSDELINEGLEVLKFLFLESRNQTDWEGNVIQMVVDSMQRFLDDESIQENGCSILRSLTLNKENRRAVVDSHGIEALLAAMTEWDDNEEIQVIGCDALCNLAQEAEYKNAVVKMGGLSVALTATRTFQRESSRSLATILTNSNIRI